ncbi:glycosyltransferase family protein [Flavisericum labens]|uniref:hypothetical protein n=1 Tax=Flavisericum labens TaxID=3377112 RepID=UPI00387B03F7
MKFLIIAQDLRISGTSEGMVSRSFIAKLRAVYPKSVIDIEYLKFHPSEDQLQLLPVNNIIEEIINFRVPFYIKWINKIYWRLYHESLNKRYIQKQYAKYIAKIDYEVYDVIFIRSAGLDYEAIIAAKDLPVLKKAIINFHDPYPVFWCAGNDRPLDNLELFRFKKMQQVVLQAKKCITPARTLTNDMGMLYNTTNKFHTLPHQYDETVFDLTNHTKVFKKSKKITICYHGAIQFGRNIIDLLDAYKELVDLNNSIKEHTEFILRLKKMSDINYLNKKYAETDNIIVLKSQNFSNASYEQTHLADINIILENGPYYSNVLVGKAPFLASIEKPILSISPNRSELRGIIKDEKYIADSNNKEDIKQKLKNLISDWNEAKKPVHPFGDYFSDDNFKRSLDAILYNE